jgi:hypothetical protein
MKVINAGIHKIKKGIGNFEKQEIEIFLKKRL